MSKTSHCVCSPNSPNIDSSLKQVSNEMPSPPLPPRTSRANASPIKTQWEQITEKGSCNKDKVQCNCNRPHSCPAEEGSPPIPPKSISQAYNKAKCQINTKFEERLSYDHKQKNDIKIASESRRQSRKSGRHNSSDGGKSRKKSRSKSKPLVKEEKSPAVRHCDEERFFIKTHDNLIEKNSELFYRTNKDFQDPNFNAKLCKISENNETNNKFVPHSTEVTNKFSSIQTHPPDLIPNRSNSTKVIQFSTVPNPEIIQKSSSKFRKFFGFLSKPKKITDVNRTITTTPEAMKSLKATEVNGRPRRSKSLHLISGLSPTASMHAQSNVISPEIKAKSSSIFAVISPTTTRLKRNLLCISPKASNANKKQASTLPMAINSKSILSDNSQQRTGLSSFSGVRLSPVHLIASNTESCCPEKDPTSNINHYNTNHLTCGDVCRNRKLRSDPQEKSNFTDIEAFTKPSPGSKIHGHSNQDPSQRKTPQSSSQTNRQMLVNNSLGQMCSCYNYQSCDNKCLCNNTYHRFCPSQAAMPPCGCVHNIVQFNHNHFHCCHHNQQVWCWVPCCPEQVPVKQNSFCSCHIYQHSASPPANFPRQLPPPPPPPPVPSFSNNHQFSRRYRHSYSKTPPPSFHHHQLPCHDEHFYQEYNLNQLPDSRQKMILSQQMRSNTYHSNCCSGFQNKQCCILNHSKCSACGSLFYDEIGSQAAHYNLNEMHKNPCSSTPACDSVFDHKLMSQSRMFSSPLNTEDSFNCRCLYNQSCHRHSETCGRHSSEIRSHNCRNSAHRSVIQPHNTVDKERSSSKHRKNSGHSCHGSNNDGENEDKHDLSRTHHNSPAANMLPSTSIHLTPELNTSSTNCDLVTMSAINNPNISNSINNMMTSSSAINQNDRKQQQFEPWRKTFHDNMMALRNLGWYWGPLNHLEAENLVQGRPDGTFLVRDSGNEAYFLSLTFRVLGTTYHTRIEYSQGKFSFWSQPESHSATTIVEFIDKAVAHSVSGKFHYFLQTNTPGQPPMEVSLLYPLSRYQIVQSLQHLSRFIILSNIRRDHVSQLELPQSIKSYLMEKQYYIDCIETFVNITKDSEPLTYEPSGRTM